MDSEIANTTNWAPNDLIAAITNDLSDLCCANEYKVTKSITNRMNADQKKFFTISPGILSVRMYIERLVTYCECSSSAFIFALIYIDQFQSKDRFLSINKQNFHRLFSTVLLLAIKFLDDEVCLNSYYADVFGFDSVDELNELELTALKLLDWNLLFDFETFQRYEKHLCIQADSEEDESEGEETGN